MDHQDTVAAAVPAQEATAVRRVMTIGVGDTVLPEDTVSRS